MPRPSLAFSLAFSLAPIKSTPFCLAAQVRIMQPVSSFALTLTTIRSNVVFLIISTARACVMPWKERPFADSTSSPMRRPARDDGESAATDDTKMPVPERWWEEVVVKGGGGGKRWWERSVSLPRLVTVERDTHGDSNASSPADAEGKAFIHSPMS